MSEPFNPYKAAMESVCVLKDLAFARSWIEFWRERRDLAGRQADAWQKEEKRLTAKNEGKPFEAVPYAQLH